MFCKYCGNPLPERANFCPKCGKMLADVGNSETINEITSEPVNEFSPEPVNEPAIFFTDTVPEYVSVETVDPVAEEERSQREGGILLMAILSLAFGESLILSWLGIIFACIARGKVSAYLAKYGATRGRATVGNILSKIGLGLSIGMTALTILYVIYFAFLIASSNGMLY